MITLTDYTNALNAYVQRNGYHSIVHVYATTRYVRGYIRVNADAIRRVRFDRGRWMLSDGLRDATRATRRVPSGTFVDTTHNNYT